MSNTRSGMLSPGEEAILTAVGYIVMRWNYAEYFARQILRQYLQGDSLADADHLKLSSRPAAWIEQKLESTALPKWTGIGRPYLQRLILAYARGREHRNHITHGVYMTFKSNGPYPAQALILSVMPKDGRPQTHTHISLDDLRPVADHLHELAMFARDVSVAFGPSGERALSADGAFALALLPSMLTPIEQCKHELF